MRAYFLLASLPWIGFAAYGWGITYTVVPLEAERPPWVIETTPYDISDSGWITGYVYPSLGSPSGGFLTTFAYHPSTGFVDLGNIPGRSTIGLGVNNLGQIVGRAPSSYGASGEVAFRYTPGVGFEDLGNLGGTGQNRGYRINSAGQVVGESQLAEGRIHAYRYTDGVGMEDLGALGGRKSVAAGLNEAGWVVGSYLTLEWEWRAFLYRDGVGMTDLGPGYGSALNDAGVVAGTVPWWGGPVLFRDGQVVPISYPGGAATSVADLNDQNVVVGGFILGSTQHAFVATEADGVLDLNTLIPADSGWELSFAYGINNHGQIVAQGFANGAMWAVRLDPIPEPAAWALFGLGAIVLWQARRRGGSR